MQLAMMLSLKTWRLLPLPVFLLLFVAPTSTEVVQSMTQCEGFLLNKVPEVPDILENGQIKGPNRYKVICQTYNDVKRFVTLYDTKNKIPVLSAYKFSGALGGRPEGELWKIEPQLEDTKKGKNMEDCNISVTYAKQAGDQDYVDVTEYNKGHLFPSSYAQNYDGKVSTFTLTNSVPQAVTFNGGSWARMEACVKCIMEKYCINNNNRIEGYVMTGAVPSENNKLNNRVNVPSLLWSAFCCYSNNLKKWIASARWGENVADKSENMLLHTRTLGELYEKRRSRVKKFDAFPETRCPRNTTVVKYYEEMNTNCHCVNNPQG